MNVLSAILFFTKLLKSDSRLSNSNLLLRCSLVVCPHLLFVFVCLTKLWHAWKPIISLVNKLQIDRAQTWKNKHMKYNHRRPISMMTRLQPCQQLLIRWQQCGTTSCVMSCREPGQHRLWLQDVFVGWAVSLGDNSVLLQIAVEENQHLFSICKSTSPAR